MAPASTMNTAPRLSPLPSAVFFQMPKWRWSTICWPQPAPPVAIIRALPAFWVRVPTRCYYDGTQILDNVPSLGWLLGGRGSGTHLGKALLHAKLYRELPADLNLAFDEAHPEGQDAIKDKVYEKGANSYLATFTRFLGDNLSHPFIQYLVAGCLNQFLDRHVLKYSGHKHVPVHFVGSIAHHFQDVLAKSMDERQTKIGGRGAETHLSTG